ncbi:MAG: enoyl-CoA hydratase/isomerase family protein [Candidatus Lokiarchaeota archaeon]|nr:enoyl-CoA hydratase/isomerase family protein [Candidatus Lokiarchaeota archaeon]
MNLETIKFELRDDGIGILTLNRPDKLNAISLQMVEDLHKILDNLMINLDCRVLILKGEGRAFCAGLDLKESLVLGTKDAPQELKDRFYFLDVPKNDNIKLFVYTQWRLSQIIVKMRKISQPIIAIIQGAAAGGGFTFALASDIRIAGENAKFNNAFIKLGVSGSDMGSSYFLPRLIGMSRAAEILYTGWFIDAYEAERIGLVLKIVEGDENQLIDSAIDLAKNMINKSPLGLKLTKQAINLSLDSPSLDTMIEMENRAQAISSRSKDMKEGVAAFFEKREPKYPLR